jgi:hypothetical protein
MVTSSAFVLGKAGIELHETSHAGTISITHILFCHVHWKSIHHDFSADLSLIGLATSISIAAFASIALSVAVSV